MGKSISIFVLSILISGILFFIFGNLFASENDVGTEIHTFGTIIVILLSFIISMMYYLIDLVKNKY